ncbi:MAG: hypothetical protein H0T72_14305 [Chloroflexia bacterium]|nr:hypothetical protein [Chloroflexia bacterium]
MQRISIAFNGRAGVSVEQAPADNQTYDLDGGQTENASVSSTQGPEGNQATDAGTPLPWLLEAVASGSPANVESNGEDGGPAPPG